MTEETTNVAVAEETEKRGRKVRDKHPAALSDGSLTETPGDFDFEIQARLVRKDFKEEHQFLTYRATDAQFRATAYQKQAAESKALGSSADRKKAKKLVKMRDSMQELMDGLRKQGVDVDKILASVPAAS